jgi:hypothetical protein
MKRICEDDRPDDRGLGLMRDFVKKVPTARWHAFQNHDLGHIDLGHLQFLAIGPDCTFKTVPKRMPDTAQSINWRYVPVGWVNMETGKIEEETETKKGG